MNIKLTINEFDSTGSAGLWVNCEGREYLIASLPIVCFDAEIITKLNDDGEANCKLEIDND